MTNIKVDEDHELKETYKFRILVLMISEPETAKKLDPVQWDILQRIWKEIYRIPQSEVQNDVWTEGIIRTIRGYQCDAEGGDTIQSRKPGHHCLKLILKNK